MYYPYFMTYMFIGFGLSLLILLWALNSGQFKDQQRARFLPLQGETPSQPLPPSDPMSRMSRARRIEFYALIGLIVVGLMLTASVLGFSIIRSAGGPHAPL
ncbi:MAG: hypothetical protein C4530_12485 [Desulfobacteraceae bacterium]|nr:MAG: hypothetical protein C4530_12485 [Desulfobacteraceae bacterium]